MRGKVECAYCKVAEPAMGEKIVEDFRSAEGICAYFVADSFNLSTHPRNGAFIIIVGRCFPITCFPIQAYACNKGLLYICGFPRNPELVAQGKLIGFQF